MKRILTTTTLTVLLAACSASSDVDSVDEADASASAETVSVCEDAMVLDLEGYPEEILPTAEDFTVWHAENAQRPGVEETDSGLQYKVIQGGADNAMTPVPGEEIFAHYHGFFPNGDVFDSSYARGTPLVYASNAFIKGWNEALADMEVCEARTLYVPADLAYGNSGAGGRPTGTLVFHMQLLRVNREETSETTSEE